MSRSALIYTAIALIAIAGVGFVALRDSGAAGTGSHMVSADIAKLEELRDGTLKKLDFLSEPKPAGKAAYHTEDGGTATLADHKGRYVLVNFWATWCAPCRKEMPGLDKLQAEFGGDDFEVLTIATGKNIPARIDKFFEETGVTNLPRSTDPTSKLAREMGVLGLPASVILAPDGMEIARMTGDAEWDSDSAKAIFAALLKRGGPQGDADAPEVN
jgi:thiol-disulfide isomerase/thioredoxin